MLTILKDETERIERLFEKYPSRRSAMLPLLWMVQEKTGWVSQDAMKEVAEILKVTPAEVYEVVSFYTMFHQRPVGKYHFALCQTLACAICGTQEIVAYLKEKHGIDGKGVTKDGRFSLELVECIGACSIAPAALVNEDLHGNLTPQSLDQLVASCS